MKRISMILALLLTCFSIYALPIGNPVDPGLLYNGVFTEQYCADFCNSCSPCETSCGTGNCFKRCFQWCNRWNTTLLLGFYGDYVFDRHMEIDRSGRLSRDIHDFRIMTNAAYLGVSICNRAEIFGTLGASRMQIAGYQFDWTLDLAEPNTYQYLQMDSGFSWSLGLKGILWECNCFAVGAQTQYFRTNANFVSARTEGLVPFYFSEDTPVNYHEWQVGLAASYTINVASVCSAIVPYLGVKWSRAYWSSNNTTINGAFNQYFDLKNRRNVGYAFGASFVGSARWDINAEVRFVDERAVSVNTQFAF